MDQHNQSNEPHTEQQHPPIQQTHPVRSRFPDRISPRYATRTAMVWLITIALVALLIAMQAIGRYASEPADIAPPSPDAIGSMQLRISARHGVGIKNFEQFLPATSGASPTQQIVDQLGELAEDQPIQLIRVAGYTHFFRPDDPTQALARLDSAEQFIADLDEQKRERWEDYGYLADIAAFRTIINESPQSLTPDQRDRLLDRYGEPATAALVARLGDETPERKAFLAQGLRTSITLIVAFLIVAIAGLTGLVLFIIGMVMLGSGRFQTQYERSLLPHLNEAQDDAQHESPQQAPPALTLESFAWFLVAFLAVQVIVGTMVVYLANALGIAESYRTLLLLPFLWALLILALWPVWRGMSGSWNRRALGLHRGKGVLREIGAGFVGYLAGLPVVALGLAGTLVMMLLSDLIGLDPDGSHPAPDMIAGGGIVPILALISLAVVWAPVVEEIFFRGALQHHLRRSHGFFLSALITGFIFAVIHPQGLVGIPVLTAIGFVFSMLREWRGSIIAPIVAHAINNGFVFTMLIVALA